MSKLRESYLASLQGETECLNEICVMAAIGGIYSAVMILKYGSDMAKQYLSKVGKECSDLSGASKNLCVIDFKLRALTMEIATLKQERRKCTKTRNPKLCNLKVNNKINMLIEKQQTLNKHREMFKDRLEKEKQQNQLASQQG